MTPLVAVTFNLRVDTPFDLSNRWSKRRHLAVQTIREFSPDILATQEPQPHQVQYLDENLPEYTRVGGGRNNGKNEGEFSPLHLKKSRLTILDSGTFWLSPSPNTPGSVGWDASLARIASWARATDLFADRTLTIINTHFDHIGQTARVQSAILLRDFLAANSLGDPIILTGDFNATDENSAVLHLLDSDAKPALLDAYRLCHPAREPDELTFHGFRGTTKGSRIDYIFHSPHLAPTSCSIVRTCYDGKYPSDHYPLATTLEWRD